MSQARTIHEIKRALEHAQSLVFEINEADIPATLIPAAVLLPIVLRDSGLTMLLTQRTAHLHNHAGQISFPGGRTDPEDRDQVATALREAEEEVGITSQQVEVIATLPHYSTGTGFRISPVVGFVSPPLNLKLDDFEVEDVFEVPLGFLLDEDNWRREHKDWDGRIREYWAIPWREHYIWGATAGMIVSFKRCLDSGGTPIKD